MLRVSRCVRLLDDLAKEEVNIKYTFFPQRDTWGFKLFMAAITIGGHGFLRTLCVFQWHRIHFAHFTHM